VHLPNQKPIFENQRQHSQLLRRHTCNENSTENKGWLFVCTAKDQCSDLRGVNCVPMFDKIGYSHTRRTPTTLTHTTRSKINTLMFLCG